MRESVWVPRTLSSSILPGRRGSLCFTRARANTDYKHVTHRPLPWPSPVLAVATRVCLRCSQFLLLTGRRGDSGRTLSPSDGPPSWSSTSSIRVSTTRTTVLGSARTGSVSSSPVLRAGPRATPLRRGTPRRSLPRRSGTPSGRLYRTRRQPWRARFGGPLCQVVLRPLVSVWGSRSAERRRRSTPRRRAQGGPRSSCASTAHNDHRVCDVTRHHPERMNALPP
jgi:hypothetical protein